MSRNACRSVRSAHPVGGFAPLFRNGEQGAFPALSCTVAASRAQHVPRYTRPARGGTPFRRLGFLVIISVAGLLGNLASLWWWQGKRERQHLVAIFGYTVPCSLACCCNGVGPGRCSGNALGPRISVYRLFTVCRIFPCQGSTTQPIWVSPEVMVSAWRLPEPVVSPRPVRWLSVRAGRSSVLAALGLDALAQTPEVVQRYQADSLISRRFSALCWTNRAVARTGYLLMDSLRQRRTTRRRRWMSRARFPAPMGARSISSRARVRRPPANGNARNWWSTRPPAGTLKAYLGIETRQMVWVERSRALQRAG